MSTPARPLAIRETEFGGISPSYTKWHSKKDYWNAAVSRLRRYAATLRMNGKNLAASKYRSC